MNIGDLHKVWEVKVLKKPGEEEARKILDRIAKQVQPIMRRRKWRVKLLSEFCPANPSLLGLNVGAGVEVKLRLRRPNRDWDFFPFEQVLDTMLHELCHIEQGPHNAQFYKLWDELRMECDELVAKGTIGTGEGFDGFGRRLGGFTRQPPASSLRQATLAAAQKRTQVGSLLPDGPRRLGGDAVIMSALSPIQAAAMAAERRMQDDLWCGSVSEEIERLYGSNELGESSNSTIDITQRKNHTSSGDVVKVSCDSPAGSTNSRNGSNSGRIYSGTHPFACSSSQSAVHDAGDRTMWACKVCTLFNQPLSPICEACGNQKPLAMELKFKTWSCKFCTLENSTKLDKCSACEQWRYSYGPPVATRGPSYGT